MLHVILAAVAVGAIAARPQSTRAATVAAAAAAADVAAGTRASFVVGAVAPLLVFLTAALSLAALRSPPVRTARRCVSTRSCAYSARC
jgi:hypothetical protein